MIKDYKGEMPNNVTTPEKAKAQKPFYKNWKFWVLTGLMTLFGACSIYGLVLGSQYVKAIERASHIIADAKSDGANSVVTLNANKRNALFGDGHDVASFDLGSKYWSKVNASATSAGRWITTDTRFDAPTNQGLAGKFFCDSYETTPWTLITSFNYDKVIGVIKSGGSTFIGIHDDSTLSMTPQEFQAYVTGKYFYFYPSSSYTGETIYQEGYEDGYQEGYSDGSDAINVPQSLKVLLPVGNQFSVQYQSYVNGVLDQQGQLNGSDTYGAWLLFTRSRNQKLRVDLTLPVDSKAFWDFRDGWTSGSQVAGDYTALQQSWAVDGVTYLPTWVGEPQLYVAVVGTDVPDLTYRTISIAFDVNHWGDIKVGAYQQGYQQGYVDGQQDPTAYQSGYDAGKEEGYKEGDTAGFNRGVAVGSSGSQSLALMFKTAFQLPFDQLYRFLNFNLLGINFLALFTALISVSIGIMVIKKVL